MKHILNLINHILSYQDSVVTDNPAMRSFDHIRRISAIGVSNPKSDSRAVPPGGSISLFNSLSPTSLSVASVLNLSLLSASSSIYRLSVSAGPSGFRTGRVVSGITTCNITINNNAIAVFNFTGATISAVQVGDIMRIKGVLMSDTGPFAFNSLNAGLWNVLAVSGTSVSCVRQAGEAFSGAVETVSAATNDVQFYSASGIQKGSKFTVSGTLSPVSQKTFEILDATPNTIDFVSAQPLPEETALTYIADSIAFYSESKRIVYIELDQDAVVRFNGSTGDSVKVSPIEAGNPLLPGFLSKWGDSYSCEVVNKSINTMYIKYFMAE